MPNCTRNPPPRQRRPVPLKYQSNQGFTARHPGLYFGPLVFSGWTSIAEASFLQNRFDDQKSDRLGPLFSETRSWQTLKGVDRGGPSSGCLATGDSSRSPYRTIHPWKCPTNSGRQSPGPTGPLRGQSRPLSLIKLHLPGISIVMGRERRDLFHPGCERAGRLGIVVGARESVRRIVETEIRSLFWRVSNQDLTRIPEIGWRKGSRGSSGRRSELADAGGASAVEVQLPGPRVV